MKKFIWLLGVLGLVGFIYYSGLSNYLSFATIKHEAQHLKVLVDQNYFMALGIYFLIFILTVMVGLPVVGPMSLLGGFLFGILPGIVASLMGALCGSIFYFLLVRYFFLSLFAHTYADRLEKFKMHIQEYGYSYLLILHFVTIVPFFVINTLAAIANIPLRHVAWTTVVGSFPLLFMYVFAGRELYHLNSAADIFKPKILLFFAILVLFSLGSIMVRKMRINSL